jgi:ribonuclease P protein component
MLAKPNRLNRPDFNTYFARGARFHSSYLTIIHTDAPVNKGSVVVSKKVAKAAHDRNRLRRRVYAILEKKFAENPAAGVYIIVVKPTVLRLTKAEAIRYLTEEIAQVPNNQ